jgi:hypothetical protein
MLKVMNISHEKLSKIDLGSFLKFAAAKGWSSRPAKQKGVIVVEKSAAIEGQKVWFPLPVEKGFADAANRLSDGIKIIAEVEGLKIGQLIDKLTTPEERVVIVGRILNVHRPKTLWPRTLRKQGFREQVKGHDGLKGITRTKVKSVALNEDSTSKSF